MRNRYGRSRRRGRGRGRGGRRTKRLGTYFVSRGGIRL